MLGFKYEAFTLFGWLSQNHSSTFYESRMQSEPQNARILVWALSLSLAATNEIDVSFSSSGYLDVSVHRVPSSYPILFRYGRQELILPGFPIQISTDHKIFAPPRGFSQLITSFIGS